MDPTPPTASSDDPARERRERQGRVLREVTDVGLELLDVLRREIADAKAALADPELPKPDTGEISRNYDRVVRALQQTLLLEDRLAEDSQEREKRLRAELLRDAAKRHRLQTQHVNAIGLSAKMVEAQVLAERRAGPRLRDRFAIALDEARDGRPVAEIFAGICKDLGIEPPDNLFDESDDWVEEADAPTGDESSDDVTPEPPADERPARPPVPDFLVEANRRRKLGPPCDMGEPRRPKERGG